MPLQMSKRCHGQRLAGDMFTAVRIKCKDMRREFGFFQNVTVRKDGKGLFDEIDPQRGTCPVLATAGVPCVLRRLEGAAENCSSKADFDNQWATYFMIEPSSGFAPPAWQDNVGPTIMYKADGTDLTEDDVCVLNDCVSTMLNQYAEGPGAVNPEVDFPAQLKSAISCYKAYQRRCHLKNG